MAEKTGANVAIKVGGAPVALVGEATTSIAGDLEYQITDAAKRVLQWDGAISVQKKGTDDTAEVGTTTTNLKMTAHGLVTGDLIVNTTRGSAARIVTRVDADNLTVAAVTGQTTGDTIQVYKTELATAYTLNRLNGKVTYASAVARVIRISGNYIPMSVAAYANDASHQRACDLLDVTPFTTTHRRRIAGLKSASGAITNLDVTDETYNTALLAGTPVYLEIDPDAALEPSRYLALLNQEEIKAAIADPMQRIISWTSKNSWLNLGK